MAAQWMVDQYVDGREMIAYRKLDHFSHVLAFESEVVYKHPVATVFGYTKFGV